MLVSSFENMKLLLGLIYIPYSQRAARDRGEGGGRGGRGGGGKRKEERSSNTCFYIVSIDNSLIM